MTDESVMSIGRMLSGLTSLTNLTVNLGSSIGLSDRSMEVMSDSISNLMLLTDLNLNLSNSGV